MYKIAVLFTGYFPGYFRIPVIAPFARSDGPASIPLWKVQRMVDSHIAAGVPIGTIAAVVGAGILIRWLLRSQKVGSLTRMQEFAVYMGAIILLSPAFTMGFTLSGFLLPHVTAEAGNWQQVMMVLSVAFPVAVVGTAVPVAAASMVLAMLLRHNALKNRAHRP